MLTGFVGERLNITLTVRGDEPDAVSVLLTDPSGAVTTHAASVLTAYSASNSVSVWRYQHEFSSAGQWQIQARANESTDEAFHNYHDGQFKFVIAIKTPPA